MPPHPTITLRYFDARGRAQPQRYYFAARGIAYTDERVSLTPGGSNPWSEMREDRARVGPFHKLPVLLYGDRSIAETLVINAFLHRALGDEALLSSTENLRHAMLVSSLYNDIVMQVGITLWAEAVYVGLDYPAFVRQVLGRIRGLLGRIDQTLGEWGWTAAARARPPMISDCLLWEELDSLQHVFGEHVGLDNLPTLSRIYLEAQGRAAFQKVLASHPAPVTGRGMVAEAEIIGRIRSYLAA
jgi:glutathione S-transferase